MAARRRACTHPTADWRRLGGSYFTVESHVNYGSTDIHQRVVSLPMLLADFLPQIGMGIKGFLFWQYRPEVLGAESPAWGLVNLDGTPRPVTEAARRFWGTLRPHAPALRESFPAPARIGVWRSRKNEIFHFCTRRECLRRGALRGEPPLSHRFGGDARARRA